MSLPPKLLFINYVIISYKTQELIAKNCKTMQKNERKKVKQFFKSAARTFYG